MQRTDRPLVTYVLPCHNHADFVEESIRSLIEQDYDPIELIVIDDGSTDGSIRPIRRMAQRCADRFVRFELVVQDNRGFVPSLNGGLDWARGSLFALHASDDVLYPAKTSRMVACLLAQDANVVAAYGGMTLIDADGRDLGRWQGRPGLYGFDDVILKKCPWATPTQMVRTDALRQAGGFDERFAYEDWAMLLALTARGGKIVITDDLVASSRRHGTNLSKRIASNHSYRLQVLDRYHDHPAYPLAKARVLAGHATEVARTDRPRAVAALKEAFETYRPIIWDHKFRRGCRSVLKSGLRAALG